MWLANWLLYVAVCRARLATVRGWLLCVADWLAAVRDCLLCVAGWLVGCCT
jgi:hypothetical protein